MRKKFTVDGMSCEHCIAHVKEALENLGGKDIVISLKTGIVEADLDVSDEEIIAEIDEAGYDVKF
ncbi:MAG: heavy-metal-associated domain-containing protein [Oscillospiraceae bacterium]